MPFIPVSSVRSSTAGPVGPTGPAGTGSASTIEAQLLADTAVGATTFNLDRSATAAIRSQGWLIIDAYTSQAEVKKINSATGAAIVLVSAMKYAHNAGDLIVVVHEGTISASLWGVSGNGSADETIAIQEAIDQCSKTEVGLWLDGQAKSYVVTQPIMLPISAKVRQMRLRAGGTFAPTDANNAMVMSMQQGGPIAFTADPATDIITTVTAHGIPADGIKVMLKGTSIPTGLVSGRLYYAYNRATTTTFKVRQGTNCSIAAVAADATVNVVDTSQFPASGNLNTGATTFTYTGKSGTTFTGCVGTPTIAINALITTDTIDITAAGSGGFVYPEVNSLEKVYLENFTIDTQAISGLNGASFALQQPAYTIGLRIDGTSATSTALTLKGQYSAHFNMELNGTTPDDGAVMLNLSGDGHCFYGIIFAHGKDGVYIPSGLAATSCVLNALWTEGFTNGIHIEGTAIGLDVSGWLISYGAVGQVAMRIESGSTSAFSITGGRGNNGSNEIIHDDSRGFVILDSAFPGGAVIDYAQASGSIAPTMPRVPKNVSTSYTALISDDLILSDAGIAALTVTLPTAVGINGKLYKVKKTDGTANVVTIATTSSQTIDGSATKTISALYGLVSVASNGTNWAVV